MAYSLLFGERPTVAASSSTSTSPFGALARWISDVRAKHTQRVALSNLLDFDQALLTDLGINRQDVVDALAHPSTATGRHLSARRAQTARDWLAHP